MNWIPPYLAFNIILVLCFSSCQKPLDCPNQSFLLSPTDSLPQLQLNFSLTDQLLEDQIRKATKNQDQKLPQKFTLTFKGKTFNTSIHAKHQNSLACYGMPAMMHKSPQLEVFLTGNNMAIMEGKDLIPLDSIPGYIHWYFPHDKPYGEKIVKFNHSPLSSSASIYNCIENISEGYLLFYEKEAQNQFSKTVCELDSKELAAVRKKYPFELRLWIGDPSAVFQ